MSLTVFRLPEPKAGDNTPVSVMSVENNWRSLAATINAQYIESYRVTIGSQIFTVIIDEEGRWKKKHTSVYKLQDGDRYIPLFVGDVIVCRETKNRTDFASLRQSDLKILWEHVHPILPLGGRYHSVMVVGK